MNAPAVPSTSSRPFWQYVGLGDSISIDDYPGAGLGAVSLLHRNRNDIHPQFRGRDLVSLNEWCQLASLAYDGATTVGVLDLQLPHLPPDGEGATLVTLTIGGNDLLQMLGIRSATASESIAFILKNIARIITHVQAAYANCVVVVGTIYDPTDGIGDISPGHVEADGLKMLNETNDLIRALPQQHSGVLIADLHRHFLGHGAHYHDRKHRHYKDADPTGWLMLDIEPNERGASEVRRVFWEALGLVSDA